MERTIPEQAFIALRELSDVCYPDISIITPDGRKYLHSGLAIHLAYYEQYLQPAFDNQVRFVYYTTKKDFPHTFVFTHVDHPLINPADMASDEWKQSLRTLSFIAGKTVHSAKVISPWARANLPCDEMQRVEEYAKEYGPAPDGMTRIYYASTVDLVDVVVTHADFDTEMLLENYR